MDDNRVSDSDILNRRAHRLDPAGVLVTQYVGKFDTGLRSPLTLDNVNVGATEPSTTDSDNHIPWACNFGLSNLFHL
jgi:hypothetical protein